MPLLSFAPLHDVPELVPVVSDWLLREWPAWYGEGAPGDLREDMAAFAASDTVLPVGIVAFLGGEPAGFGALKRESIRTHTHLGPWATAGYVRPALRGQGIGAGLLRTLASHAGRLGHPSIYCGTSTAQPLLRRLGWHELERILH